jgi:hypothetical protein
MIVGDPMSGKTTNLQILYEVLNLMKSRELEEKVDEHIKQAQARKG